ncbi:MAG: LysR family transcriptional regulator, partial [Alphaproteobacteria bacterium]
MNIRQLESFVAIVDRGGFGAAAEALATTQSTVSARIRELERRLGVALFDRS